MTRSTPPMATMMAIARALQRTGSERAGCPAKRTSALLGARQQWPCYRAVWGFSACGKRDWV